ncbi:MAG: hypothetical protein DLD55_01145 [candidate division SR1 bacterium]|nr:MAG: hypothetical protein DLD55_01145 [candidate division SR1 bacterium]
MSQNRKDFYWFFIFGLGIAMIGVFFIGNDWGTAISLFSLGTTIVAFAWIFNPDNNKEFAKKIDELNEKIDKLSKKIDLTTQSTSDDKKTS